MTGSPLIGAAISSSLGADFICYVTPAEHLALPTPEEVFEGVISSRIAAHVGDMIKLKKTCGRPRDGSRPARPRLGTPVRCRHEPCPGKEIRAERMPADTDGCTMCGDFCAIKIVNRYFKSKDNPFF